MRSHQHPIHQPAKWYTQNDRKWHAFEDRHQLRNSLEKSGREDLNLRPLRPERKYLESIEPAKQGVSKNPSEHIPQIVPQRAGKRVAEIAETLRRELSESEILRLVYLLSTSPIQGNDQ